MKTTKMLTILVLALLSISSPVIASSPLEQFASSATASSEWGAYWWGTIQATGVPNTFDCDDIDTAWAPSDWTSDPEWLEVSFDVAVHATALTVYETYETGFIYQVDLIDTESVYHTIWTGTDTTECPGEFTLTFDVTSYQVAGIKIYTQNDDFEEIDAVRLIGWADTDNDGIFDVVDTEPNTLSNDFSDVVWGGTTTGTITAQGGQILTVRDEVSEGLNQVTAVIPISSEVYNGPRGMESGLTPVGVRVYAALAQSNEVAVIDPNTNLIVTRIPTPADSYPWRVRLNPDGTELYVSLRDASEVLVIDTQTNNELATITDFNRPADIAFDDSNAFVVNHGRRPSPGTTVAVVNTDTRAVEETIEVGQRPTELALTPGGQFLYVTNTGSGTISVISVATRSVVETIPAGSEPWGIAITPDGQFAYVSDHSEAVVRVFDLSTNTVVQTITSPFLDSPNGLAITPDGRFVYVANVAWWGNPIYDYDRAPKNVTVIRTADNTVVTAVNVFGLVYEHGPRDVTILPDGTKAYTNDGDLGESVFEIGTDSSDKGVRITADISGGGQPATISICDGSAEPRLKAGDDVIVLCGSVTIEVISGIVDVNFVAADDTLATVSLAAGNRLTFEPTTFTFTAPSTNPDVAVVVVDGEELYLAPGESITFANQPPVADAGPDQIVEQESYDGTVVTLNGSGSTDSDSTPGTNDDIVSFDWYEADTFLGTGETINHTFPLGTHTVTLLVTDSSGEIDDDQVTIVVQDTTPPELTLSVTPDTLWPPNHKMVQVTPAWTAIDLCDQDPDVSLKSIIMSEGDATNTFDPLYDYTANDGDTIDDIQVGPDGSIYLRAERRGNGNGRVYSITYQAVDDSGNTTTAAVEVTVPHDQG